MPKIFLVVDWGWPGACELEYKLSKCFRGLEREHSLEIEGDVVEGAVEESFEIREFHLTIAVFDERGLNTEASEGFREAFHADMIVRFDFQLGKYGEDFEKIGGDLSPTVVGGTVTIQFERLDIESETRHW
jgi:hypothetical protein